MSDCSFSRRFVVVVVVAVDVVAAAAAAAAFCHLFVQQLTSPVSC